MKLSLRQSALPSGKTDILSPPPLHTGVFNTEIIITQTIFTVQREIRSTIMIINRHSRSRTLYFDAPSARSAQKSGSHSVRSASSNPITPGLQIRSLRSFKSPIRCSGAAEYVKKQRAGWLKTNNISHHLRFVAHSADERRDPLATTAKSGRNRTMISLLTSDPHTGIQIIKNCRDRG